jgi:hypothetical protein
VSALKSDRRRHLEEKLVAPSYNDQGLIFASREGKLLGAQNVVNRYYKSLLERASLSASTTSGIGCLSLLAQRSEPIRDLQALAERATAAFTL